MIDDKTLALMAATIAAGIVPVTDLNDLDGLRKRSSQVSRLSVHIASIIAEDIEESSKEETPKAGALDTEDPEVDL